MIKSYNSGFRLFLLSILYVGLFHAVKAEEVNRLVSDTVVTVKAQPEGSLAVYNKKIEAYCSANYPAELKGVFIERPLKVRLIISTKGVVSVSKVKNNPKQFDCTELLKDAVRVVGKRWTVASLRNEQVDQETWIKVKLKEDKTPFITNDAVVFGLLLLCLGIVFISSNSENKVLKMFYKVVPALLMCYMLPAILNTTGLISSKHSNLWSIAKTYFLPASLVLMTLSTDLKGIIKLGPKALIMFFTATLGIIIGGPLAILIMSWISPETVGGVGPDAVWKGLSTLAGSWIGGGANQTAMLELYEFNKDKYSGMILIDIVVANIWMAFLLYGAGRAAKIDKWLKADTSAIDRLKKTMEDYQASVQRTATLPDLIKILAIAFTAVGLSHFCADSIASMLKGSSLESSILGNGFFWVVVISTSVGLGLSFTKARKLEGAGASKLGSVFIYVLVAIIGMKMDILKIFDNPLLIFVGLIWMAFHVGLLFLVAKIVRAPFFFLAVGSKANVGGAASAPVVASAFHPSLAPVGVLLAVLGYALGTYGAILCAELMSQIAPVPPY